MLSRFLLVVLLFSVSCTSSKEGEFQSVPVVEAPEQEVSQNLSFEEFLDAAHQAYQKKNVKNLEKLLEIYRGRFTRPEERKEVQLLEALLFLSQKASSKAQGILEPLSKDSDPSLKGRALFYLGEILRRENRLPQAVSTYLKAYKFFPSDEIYESLADTYSQMGQWNKAIQYYQKFLSKYPDDVNNLFLLGAAYYKSKKLALSKKMMQKVMTLNPRNPYAYQYLAHIARDQKDLRNYYYNLSRGILLLKEYEAVIKLLQDQDLVYKDADLASILMSSFMREKKPDKALQVYRRTIKENPSLEKTPDFQMYYGILEVLPREGNATGKKYFQNLIRTYPDNFLIISTYADIVKSLNENDPELEEAYRKLLYLDPTDTASRYQLAEFYNNQKKIQMAQLEYGILYFYQDQKEEALESLLNLEKKSPQFQNVQLFLYIGLLYQQKEDWNLAQKYYQKVLSINKDDPQALAALKNLGRLRKKTISLH